MLNMQKKGRECYIMLAVQRNTEETPEQHLKKFLADNPAIHGTPVESIDIGGYRWAKTTFTHGGWQAMYVARFKNLHQVRITFQGEELKGDPLMAAVMESFRFKL
jgi:hypothetical protein